MKILIVDDMPEDRILLRAVTESAGHQTVEATNGAEALAILEHEEVDAIISDILMPRMDGYRFCYEVRSNERLCSLPFIFYTSSYMSAGDEKLAFEMGADKFLTKPTRAPKIIEALDEATRFGRRQPARVEPARALELMKEYNQQLMAQLARKNSELEARNEQLLRSEQKLLLQSTALETTANAVLITDTRGVIIWANSALTSLTGYTAEEVVGKTPRLLKSGRHDRAFYQDLWETLLAGKTWRGTFINRRKDGSLYHDEHTITPVRDPTGKLTHFIAIMDDVTERIRAEERIAEQAALLDKARDGILVRDLEGIVLFWNKGAERIYGWTSQEVVGKKASEFLYRDPSIFNDLNAFVIAHGEYNGELHHLTKTGHEIIIEARWTLIRDEKGNPKSILAINTDITEQKKIEAQFMRAQRMESIGVLAGGIAHDLNNILTPIMMSIGILKTQPNPDQTRSILDTMELSTRRGADIVRQVLSFARGAEGERVELQPKLLIKDLETIVKDTFPKDIKLQFLSPADVWTMVGDPTQIHQVLLNLCLNARDAMPNGGSLKIGVENCTLDEHMAGLNFQAKPGRYILLNVSDTGVGIARELLDKIFEPFFTTKELSKGTGLGLSTVISIVKSHGGFVSVHSELGNGTTFKVYFPAMETMSGMQEDPLERMSLPRGQGETILVIDDEASILKVTGQTLVSYGYRVLTANDGAEGVAVYNLHRDDIAMVLTDMMMPVMSGSALIRELLRINPAVKIVAASGLNPGGQTADAPTPGVECFLSKPYSAAALLQTLRTLLNDSRKEAPTAGVTGP